MPKSGNRLAVRRWYGGVWSRKEPAERTGLTGFDPRRSAHSRGRCRPRSTTRSLARGGIAADDPGSPHGHADRRGVRPAGRPRSAAPGQPRRGRRAWIAEDPAAAQARVVTPLSQEGARLLDGVGASGSRAFASLTQTLAALAPPHGARSVHLPARRGDRAVPHSSSVTRVRAGDAHRAAADRAQTPRRSPRPALRDTAVLERGARMRTLYQHSARRSPVTRKYVAP